MVQALRPTRPLGRMIRFISFVFFSQCMCPRVSQFHHVIRFLCTHRQAPPQAHKGDGLRRQVNPPKLPEEAQGSVIRSVGEAAAESHRLGSGEPAHRSVDCRAREGGRVSGSEKTKTTDGGSLGGQPIGRGG